MHRRVALDVLNTETAGFLDLVTGRGARQR
jgi:hypothetical protein